MPLYDYECLSCGNQFEVRQSFSEAGSAQCPICQYRARRVFHSVPILFKGSGFYTTDNNRSSASSPPEGKTREEEKGREKASTQARGKKGDGEKAKDRVSSKAEGTGSGEGASPAGD